MNIRVGFEMIYDFPQATPLIAVVGMHFTRASDVISPDHLITSPSVTITPYRDGFGNWCSRIVAPAGRMRPFANGTIRDSGAPDMIVPSAAQHVVADLPSDTIVMPPPYAAGDFAGWFEAYLGGRSCTFNARNNIPRIGRILIAQGRDAADVLSSQTFGPNTLVSFKVWIDEIAETAGAQASDYP
jgi:hypothetical protein